MSNIYNKFVKRILDIIMGVIGIIVSIPIGLIISIILLITQGRPIFFSQIRMGLNGKKFKIYKFRTMDVQAEKMKEKFTEEEKKEYDENFKLQNDCRTTVFGKLLRKSYLDELPQFWNILKGDMSLIGPRPIVEKELEKYGEKKEEFLSKKPGLTGYWQAYANKTTTYKERIKMELYYVDNVTFLFDLKLFFKSIVKLASLGDFNKKHSYKLTIVDFIDCIKFVLLFPISKIFFRHLKKQKIWIVAENPNEACDNGYIFYKYLKKEHPEINSYYIIKKGVKDYEKVEKLGNVIFYRSLKHWIYYLNADKIFVTQKYANPSQALFYVLHNMNIIKNKRIFLQHGITKEEVPCFFYNKTKFYKFICGAKREYDFVSNKFGYPDNDVVYTGFARFDNLSLKPNNNSKMILIMPTWRKWIFNLKEDYEYFQVYNNLVNNKKLINYLKQKGYQINFVLHKNMKLYKEKIESNNNVIKIYNNEEIDIQELLNKCRMLVTDYSSIAMDAAYRQIPVIYYQFDLKKFAEEHHKFEGSYFSYPKDGFGEIITNEEKLVNKIIDCCEKDFKIEEKYLNRMREFFEIRDQNNCERIFLSCKD